MPDHDIPAFRTALDTLTMRQRTALEMRCRQGHGMTDIAQQHGVVTESVRNLMLRAYAKVRDHPELAEVNGQNLAEAVCYRLGYEQALQEIEATMARKRAA